MQELADLDAIWNGLGNVKIEKVSTDRPHECSRQYHRVTTFLYFHSLNLIHHLPQPNLADGMQYPPII